MKVLSSHKWQKIHMQCISHLNVHKIIFKCINWDIEKTTTGETETSYLSPHILRYKSSCGSGVEQDKHLRSTHSNNATSNLKRQQGKVSVHIFHNSRHCYEREDAAKERQYLRKTVKGLFIYWVRFPLSIELALLFFLFFIVIGTILVISVAHNQRNIKPTNYFTFEKRKKLLSLRS